MPLDPRIALGVQQPQAPNPYEALDFALRVRQAKRLEHAQELEAERREREATTKAQEAQQKADSLALLNSVMQNAVVRGEDGSASLDRTRVQNAFAESGRFDLYQQVAPHLDEVDKSALELKKLDAQVKALEDARKGVQQRGLAAIAYGVHLAGNTPEALLFGAAQAKANGWATDEELKPYLDAAQQNPEAVKQITSSLVALDPEYARMLGGGPRAGTGDFTLGPGQSRFSESGDLLASVPDRQAAARGGVNVGSFEDYVLRAAAEKGKTPEQLTTAEIEQARKRYQQADDRPRAEGGSKPLSPTAESNIINRLSTQWTKATENLRELNYQVGIMETGLNAARRGDMAAGSQAVLIVFQKILDPTSVVRESEYARSAAGQSLLSRIRGYKERLEKGGAGVPLDELEKFAKLAKEMVSRAPSGLKATEARIRATAKRYNIPEELVVEPIPTGDTPTEAPGAQAAPAGGGMGLSYQDYLRSRQKK